MPYIWVIKHFRLLYSVVLFWIDSQLINSLHIRVRLVCARVLVSR